MLDAKRRRFFIIFLVVAIALSAIYAIRNRSSDDLTSFIKDTITPACSNQAFMDEFKLKLAEINLILNELKKNYETYISQDKSITAVKLTEAFKMLDKSLGSLHHLQSHVDDSDQNKMELLDIKEHLRVYNMKSPNDKNFDCVKSREIQVQTTICVHDIGRDIYVSGSIKGSGVWEAGLVSLFMRMLASNPDLNVFDIGAQLGQFTLYAAKFGRMVMAVEPFYDSYTRLHKSALLENTQDKITLITNGLSDKRGEYKRLQIVSSNVGGQSLFGDPNDYAARANETSVKNDPYIIETVLMDDLVEVLPTGFKKAIMKIDIEGYELKAFLKASKLFAAVDIYAVFIEWMGKSDPVRFPDNVIDEYLNFMYSRDFEVRHPDSLGVLERSHHRQWPGDIVWVKKGFKF